MVLPQDRKARRFKHRLRNRNCPVSCVLSGRRWSFTPGNRTCRGTRQGSQARGKRRRCRFWQLGHSLVTHSAPAKKHDPAQGRRIQTVSQQVPPLFSGRRPGIPSPAIQFPREERGFTGCERTKFWHALCQGTTSQLAEKLPWERRCAKGHEFTRAISCLNERAGFSPRAIYPEFNPKPGLFPQAVQSGQ
jgi:hypothetical protein